MKKLVMNGGNIYMEDGVREMDKDELLKVSMLNPNMRLSFLVRDFQKYSAEEKKMILTSPHDIVCVVKGVLKNYKKYGFDKVIWMDRFEDKLRKAFMNSDVGALKSALEGVPSYTALMVYANNPKNITRLSKIRKFMRPVFLKAWLVHTKLSPPRLIRRR